MKQWLFLVLAISLVAIAPAAVADTFTLANYSVSLNTSDPGLVLHSDPALVTPHDFNLSPNGGSTGWFNLFDLWTDETTVNSDDTALKNIGVTLNFSQPLVTGTVSGQTYGSSTWVLFGLINIQAGHVTWGGPEAVNFGDGGQFTIYLKDADFNTGVYGLLNGECFGADIYAKIVYDQAPASVPEPGSLMLLGSGLLTGAGWLRRKLAK